MLHRKTFVMKYLAQKLIDVLTCIHRPYCLQVKVPALFVSPPLTSRRTFRYADVMLQLCAEKQTALAFGWQDH